MRIMDLPTRELQVIPVLGRAMLIGGGGYDGSAKALTRLNAPDRATSALKGIVGVTDPNENLALLSASRQYFEILPPYGVWDFAVQLGGVRNVPLEVNVSAVAAGFDAAAIPTHGMIPLGSLTIADGVVARQKTGVIVVLTRQLLEAAGSAGETVLNRTLGAALALAADRLFLNSIVDSGTIEIVGTTSDTFGTILAEMTAAIEATSTSRLLLAVSPEIARGLASSIGDTGSRFPEMSANGGRVGQLPIRPTGALAAGEAILIDCDQVAGGNEGILELSVSGSAALQMTDNPAAGPAEMVAMFQTGSKALRAIRSLGFSVLNPAAVVKAVNVPGA